MQNPKPLPTRVLKLSAPLPDHQGSYCIDEITFRHPKARLFRMYGNPKRVASVFDKDQPNIARVDQIVDEVVYIKFIAEMTGLDESQIDDMTSFDYLMAKVIVDEMLVTAVTDKDGNPTNRSPS